MTTIAYKDGEIAADSQSEWHYKSTGTKKIYKKGNIMVGFAGELGLGELFTKWILGKGEKPTMSTDADFCAIVIRNGKCMHYDQNLVPLASEEYSAIGSGARYAIGAMDAGLSAKEAVKIARRRDSGTGGRIRTLSAK